MGRRWNVRMSRCGSWLSHREGCVVVENSRLPSWLQARNGDARSLAQVHEQILHIRQRTSSSALIVSAALLKALTCKASVRRLMVCRSFLFLWCCAACSGCVPFLCRGLKPQRLWPICPASRAMHTVKAVADAYFNHLNTLEHLVHLLRSALWAALQVFSVFNGPHCASSISFELCRFA